MARFDNDMTAAETLDALIEEYPGLTEFISDLDEKYFNFSEELLIGSLMAKRVVIEMVNGIIDRTEDEDEKQELMKKGILVMAEMLYLMITLELKDEMGF